MSWVWQPLPAIPTGGAAVYDESISISANSIATDVAYPIFENAISTSASAALSQSSAAEIPTGLTLEGTSGLTPEGWVTFIESLEFDGAASAGISNTQDMVSSISMEADAIVTEINLYTADTIITLAASGQHTLSEYLFALEQTSFEAGATAEASSMLTGSNVVALNLKGDLNVLEGLECNVFIDLATGTAFVVILSGRRIIAIKEVELRPSNFIDVVMPNHYVQRDMQISEPSINVILPNPARDVELPAPSVDLII